MDQEDNTKTIRKRQKLSDKFKYLCQQQLHRQPPAYMINYVKEKHIEFDIQTFQIDDLPFLPYLFTMPVNKIRVFKVCDKKKSVSIKAQCFYETSKFKDFIRQIANAIKTLQSIKSIVFQGFPLQMKHMHLFNTNDALISSTNIKQFALKNCSLTDQHLYKIQGCLAKNQSLVFLDFSHNNLKEGGIVGKILSEHSARRDEMIWMASLRSQQLEQDLSKKGICEINLQKNKFGDRGVCDMIEFLKDDQWTRCINLRDNELSEVGIKLFARLMKKNFTIISLDLRGNPGFNKQYSMYMYKKLRENIERCKQEKKKYQNPDADVQRKPTHKSMYHSQRQSGQAKKLGSTLQFNGVNANNTTNFAKSGNNISLTEQNTRCSKCEQKTLQMLKLSKKNLDLHVQIKKLHVLLNKNIDISAIFPNQQTLQQQNSANQSFHRSNLLTGGQSDEQLLMKVEQIMNELTKIMENIQGQQNTQINISNNLSNANSLSRTIPLFERPDQGLLGGQQIIIQGSENDINDQTT